MGIRIDPTLTTTPGNPPPVGTGGLGIHSGNPISSNPAQEVINIALSATINSRPDNSVTLPRDPVTNLPSALLDEYIRFQFRWANLDPNNHTYGRYVVRHNLDTGVYNVVVDNPTALISGAGTQRIVFDVLEPREWRIDIYGPAGAMPDGWFVECVKLSNEAAYDNTAVPKHHPSRYFVPEFLTEVPRWNMVYMRMVKAMASEAGTITGFYPRAADMYSGEYSSAGYYVYPLDVMVSFCNEFGIIPWFNLSAAMIPEAIDDFATYVRDNLDPTLQVHVSVGNEYWLASVYDSLGARYFWHEVWKKFKPKGTGTVVIDKATRLATFTGAPDIRTLNGRPDQRNLDICIDNYVYALDMFGDASTPAPTATQAYLRAWVKEDYIRDENTSEWWYNDVNDQMRDESYTIVAVKQFKRWSDIFSAGGQRARLVCCWETQLAGNNRFKAVSDPSYWQPFADYIEPLSVVDAVAINNYFGNGTFKKAGDSTTELGPDGKPLWLDNDFTAYIRPLAAPEYAPDYTLYSQALRDYMLDIPIPGVALASKSIPSHNIPLAKSFLATIRPYSNTTTGKRIRFVQYEGSAHIIHDVLDPVKRPTDADILEAYTVGFRFSSESVEVWTAWGETGIRFYDFALKQFNFIQPISFFGAYGLVEYFGGPVDTRQQFLLDNFVNRAPWWTEDYPPQAVPIPDQTWAAGGNPAFALDDWVSNNATSFSGTPPAGTTLNTATGEITGAPTAAAAADYTFVATNAAGDSDDIVINITVTA